MNRQELQKLQWKLRDRQGQIGKIVTPSLAETLEKLHNQDKIDAISAVLRGEPIPSHARDAAAELGI